jgi:hypothetical protein
MYYNVSKAHSQLVATCLFSKADKDVEFINYEKYYKDEDK